MSATIEIQKHRLQYHLHQVDNQSGISRVQSASQLVDVRKSLSAMVKLFLWGSVVDRFEMHK